MKYDVGDIVEFIPQNCPYDIFEGTGIILDSSNGKYFIKFYTLTKYNSKRLYSVELEPQSIEIDIDFANNNELFKILA